MTTLEPLDLLASLVLDNGRRWGDIATPWQWACAQTLVDPSAAPNRWESRPRGGSKTTDMAALAIVMLTSVLPAGAETHTYARDLDQARRIRDFIAGFVRRTPGLARELQVDRYVVTARSGSTMTIESADAASAYGQLSAFSLVDELCQWPDVENSRTLWEAVSSGMGKVPGARLCVITTSGDPGSWAHTIYKSAQRSRRWTVQDVPGPLPWVDAEFLEDQRHELPPSAYARLHENRWVAGEDRLAAAEDLEACITLAGPLPPGTGRSYVVTADLGLVKDRTVVAVMHAESVRDADGQPRGHRVVLDQMRVWQGTRRNPVTIADVEAAIYEWCRQYRARAVVDPHEAVHVIQDLTAKGIRIAAYNFTTTSVGNLGLGLFQAIRSHRLAIWRDADLIDELLNVKLIERTVGSYRLDHSAGRHDDRAVALALGIVALATEEGGPRGPVILSDEEFAELMAANDRINGDERHPVAAKPGWQFSMDTSMRASVDDADPTDDEDDQRGKVVRSPFA